MANHDKIRGEKLEYDINREEQKYQHCHPKILINTNILQAKKSCPQIKAE